MKLNNPWMIAVWPGMGNVAISAGYYLMAKLEMDLLAEFSARELFEVEHIEVKDGLVHTGRLPRSRLFVWRDPSGRRDVIVFLGEAQPPAGKYAFCRRLIDFARELGVERVFTFAAMATNMQPGNEPRVFGVSADKGSLEELKQLDIEILQEGRIGGLNGVLLGVAADNAMPGACLLGEIPHVFSQLPMPKASLAVLDAFLVLAGMDIDTDELSHQARLMDKRLIEILGQVKQAMQEQLSEASGDEDEPFGYQPPDFDPVNEEDEERLERLFAQAEKDRSTAYELKAELDRLGVFDEYEDRFLDLFKNRG